ncbi:MAG: 8-oxo-dGTP pyrophosphatase MutT (NUDIX family) [Planctomycetota bacterium]|jgi:8-oxo-dGTP pyrophosphatase MutT (NUDIX family)
MPTDSSDSPKPELPQFPPFPIASTSRVYDSAWCALDRDEIELPGGKLGEYHIFRIPDAVAVVPVTKDGDVIMVWQHRHPHGKTHWEIPAGRCEPDETPAESALRELEEETGHRPGQLIELPGFYPINGISDHKAHVYLALDCEPTGTLNLDEGERLIVATQPMEQVRKDLTRGAFADGFTAISLFYAFSKLDSLASSTED